MNRDELVAAQFELPPDTRIDPFAPIDPNNLRDPRNAPTAAAIDVATRQVGMVDRMAALSARFWAARKQDLILARMNTPLTPRSSGGKVSA